MKKVKKSDRRLQSLSQTKIKALLVIPEAEEGSSINVTRTYVIPNRWNIEKQQNTSGSGPATSDIQIEEDLGGASFKEGTAASQTDINRFQETRLFSPVELKRRALESFERSEQRRKELLAQESSLETDH